MWSHGAWTTTMCIVITITNCNFISLLSILKKQQFFLQVLENILFHHSSSTRGSFGKLFVLMSSLRIDSVLLKITLLLTGNQAFLRFEFFSIWQRDNQDLFLILSTDLYPIIKNLIGHLFMGCKIKRKT